MTIGQAVVAVSLSNSLPADTSTSSQLPPGLYLPSKDHLSHALMSSGAFHAIPPGCPTDYILPKNGPFTPLFFSPPEFNVIRRLTQLLLGDMPPAGGTKAAIVMEEVAEWIDLRVASAEGIRNAALRLDPLHRALTVAYSGAAQVNQLETATPEKVCREGLDWLANAAQSRGSDQFLSVAEEQQVAVLDSISDQRAEKHSDNAGTRFFTYLKAEIARGFYTSQIGLKELDFKGNAYYARSPGCKSKRT